MTIEPEEYVALNQPETENPSAVSFIQDKYESLKNRIKNAGFTICGILLTTLNMVELMAGLMMLRHCEHDTYTPAYFVVAGLIGGAAKIGQFIVYRSRRCPKIYQVFYPFYVFEFFWLIAGTYYYVLTTKDREGCRSTTYNFCFWLIVSNFVCLKVCLLIFCWALTLIFALVYFKNKVVQFLAKSMRF